MSQVDNVIPNVGSVYLSDFKVYALVVYSYNARDNDILINFLQDFCFGRQTILIGDFNLPSLSWLSG